MAFLKKLIDVLIFVMVEFWHGGERLGMLKVVVFDSGQGGELLADRIEEELPVEVVRVINWREANEILKSARQARKIAIKSLKQYIGNVDLIIFANYLLTITSLKFFQRKFKRQKFIGVNLKESDTFIKKNILILTTNAVQKTFKCRSFVFRMRHHNVKTLVVDEWASKIDDGELREFEIWKMWRYLTMEDFKVAEIILALSQLNDIKPELRKIFGNNIRIYDGFDEAVRNACKVLKIRGSLKKRK